MQKLRSGLALLCVVASCQQQPPPKPADVDAGKHRLADEDPRSWTSYPVLLLVSTKYRVGIDTTAQLLTQFDNRFEGNGVDFEPTVPIAANLYQEDARPVQEDQAFLATQAQRLHLPTATVAGIISDFYLIGGSNRSFPESNRQP